MLPNSVGLVLGTLFNKTWLLQGNVIYLQQVKETRSISKALPPQGRLSLCFSHNFFNYMLTSSF